MGVASSTILTTRTEGLSILSDMVSSAKMGEEKRS